MSQARPEIILNQAGEVRVTVQTQQGTSITTRGGDGKVVVSTIPARAEIPIQVINGVVIDKPVVQRINVDVTPVSDVNINVNFSAQGTPGPAGTSFTSGAGVPSGGSGSVGDMYLNETTGELSKKTGVSTWTVLGVLALSVDNLSSTFMCPDGTPREALLAE